MNVLSFSLLGVGFLLGVRHAFDVDHIAAVSTIVSRHSSIRKSSMLGIFWGFGHAISLLIVGLIVLLLKITIPEKVSLSLELIVGLMLIALGINTVSTIKSNKIHWHKHRHGEEEHLHFHSHKLTEKHEHEHLSLHKSLLMGLIHGLAGSAALTLLVLTATSSFWIGLIYILIFGAGSIIGMAAISSIISLPFALIPNKLDRTQKMLRISTGLISIIMGSAVLYKIGLTNGFLT